MRRWRTEESGSFWPARLSVPLDLFSCRGRINVSCLVWVGGRQEREKGRQMDSAFKERKREGRTVLDLISFFPLCVCACVCACMLMCVYSCVYACVCVRMRVSVWVGGWEGGWVCG